MNDMPIILNRRQAGPAIEGALRHEQVELTRLAVDTHGHTHFAMALAKLVGFDLCPRLAGLSTRKLYLPRGLFATDIGAFTSCYGEKDGGSTTSARTGFINAYVNRFGGVLNWALDEGYIRSEEHTSELQSLMRNSYAVF